MIVHQVFALAFKNHAGSLVKVDSIYSSASKAEAAAWAINPPKGLMPWVITFELDKPVEIGLHSLELMYADFKKAQS